MNYVYLKKSNW